MSEKPKIIYISGIPLSKIQSEKINIPWFLSQGIEVEYWDLTNIYYSEKALDLYFSGHPDFHKNNFPLHRVFSNIKSVKTALNEASTNTVFCNLDGFNLSSFWLLRVFKRNNLRYYIGPWRTIQPNQINSKPFLLKMFASMLDGTLVKKILKLNSNNIFLFKLKLLIYRLTNYYQKPDFVIGMGSVGREQCRSIFAVNKFISIRSIDLSWEKLPNLINQKYCVYIDESIIYSPDTGLTFATKNNSTSSNFEKFKINLCRVFDIVEEKLGIKVIISCSGKYKYEDENIFGDREMLYGKTNQLIQHSELVLSHASSGAYQSIIDKKPLILLNDLTFEKNKKFVIPIIAEWLNVKCIWTNEFSSKNLDKLYINSSHFTTIEEQYFADKDAVDDYQIVIAKHFALIN